MLGTAWDAATKMRDELIDITRMLMKLPPAVRVDLPAPTEGGDLSHAFDPRHLRPTPQLLLRRPRGYGFGRQSGNDAGRHRMQCWRA